MTDVSVMSPVRIAFCITDLDPGGAERALVQLALRLDRTRWEPRVYCLGKSGALVDVLQRAGIPVLCLEIRRWWPCGAMWRLTDELRRFRPQVLQTFLFHANIVGRIAGWLAGVPHRISGIRVAEKRSRIYLWIDRWTDWLVDFQVCVSEGVAVFTEREGKIARKKLRVIANGVEAERFRTAEPADWSQLELGDRPDVWVTAGRLDPQKGPWLLFDAVQKLSLKYPDLRLLWAGAGPLKEQMQAWIVQHRLERVIHLIGWRGDMPSVLRAAHGFVLFSLWEGMPNVVLEALAAGLPVISSRVEGVDEIIEDGNTGWLAPVGDVDELVSIWAQILDDPELRRRVAEAGQSRICAEFSWDTMVQRYAEFYEELLNESSGVNPNVTQKI